MTKQDISKIVGFNVVRMRHNLDLQQAELAAMIGSSSAHLSTLERGKTFASMEMIARLCNALGCAPHELYLPIRTTPSSM